MTEPTTGPKPARRGRWLRRLTWIGGALAALLVALYFIATSSAFLKAVVLPRVGKAMNADVTVAEVQFSPFSSIVLRNVKVTPKGAEPVFTAAEMRARYSLISILGGHIAVQEVTLDSPAVTIVENADGTGNLDPLRKGGKPATQPGTAPPPAKPSAPPVLDIKSVTLRNATIRQIKNLKGGGRQSLELANVSVTASNLRNGGAGKVDFTASLSMDKTPAASAATTSLQASLNGGFTFDLAKDLKPATLKGNAAFAIGKATGDFADFGGLAARLDCDATPAEVKQMALRFTKADAPLGELRVSGPFDAAKTEGRLNVTLLALDRRVLNLFGAASGIEFGTTTLNSTNLVELAKGGSVITASGQFDAARVKITRRSQTTPTLDLLANYAVSINRAEQSALLKTVLLTATQNQRPLLQATLDRPMTVAWGNGAGGAGDAALNLNLTGLNLADWRAFAPELDAEGLADAKLKLLSLQGGKQLTFDLDAQVGGLSVKLGDKTIRGADVHMQSRGHGTDLKQFALDEYRLELTRQGLPSLTLSGSGTFDRTTQDADLQMALKAALPRLLVAFPQPGVNVSSGTVELTGRVGSKSQTQSITGQLAITDLSGQCGNCRFDHFGGAMDLDVARQAGQIEIRKAAGDLRQGENTGGKFDASGRFDPAGKSGQVNIELAGFNHSGLRPFLEPALGDKKLVSVSLDGSASAVFEANGNTAVKADLQVTNLVVSDPKGRLPATPLEGRAQVDMAVSKQVARLQQCQITLTPTPRAKNELRLTGTVDFSKTNAIAGALKFAADSLDVTRYYDLFAGKSKSATENAAPRTETPSSTSPNQEPDAVELPFRNFEAGVNVGRLYLHEVEVTNLQASVKVEGGRVFVKPCQLALNGATVSATVDLDLGVPGFKYDVAFNADKVPLAPLVNSFQPDRAGQIGGTLTASVQAKGAGMTGAGLHKNLTGQFDVVSTNLNYSIANVRSKFVNTVVNVVVGIPDLLRNPAGVVENFLGGLFGAKQRAPSGWASELTAAPIDVIAVHGSAGNGQILVRDAVVRSTAFQAQATGAINLENILSNSTLRIPVVVSLSRSMAGRIGLTGAGAQSGDAYVAMPEFLTERGTLGDPKADINKIALAELAARTGVGVATEIGGATGGKVGAILDAVGGLLGGGTAPAPATPGTNQPPQPQRRSGLLDLLGPPK